jgi:hypothetical protein
MVAPPGAFIVEFDINNLMRFLVSHVDHSDHVERYRSALGPQDNRLDLPKYRFLFRIDVLPGAKGG